MGRSRSRTRRKKYYKGLKRRYCCPGKRRPKTRRCGSFDSRITIKNRNWRRISVYPFINFVRFIRKKFSLQKVPIQEIVKFSERCWKRLRKCEKQVFKDEAKRARRRGYRT